MKVKSIHNTKRKYQLLFCCRSNFVEHDNMVLGHYGDIDYKSWKLIIISYLYLDPVSFPIKEGKLFSLSFKENTRNI